MYRKGDRYVVKKGRTYFLFPYPGYAGGMFKKLIGEYANALLNSNGGILVFGVDAKEIVQGFPITRELEDSYKCTFDDVIKQFMPTLHPHQYRLDVLYLNQTDNKGIFEMRISAGDPTDIFQNQNKEMFIVRDKRLYGPLFPCEITQIVLQKYKEEISTLLQENAARKQTSEKQTSEAAEGVATPPPEKEQQQLPEAKNPKIQRIGWP